MFYRKPKGMTQNGCNPWSKLKCISWDRFVSVGLLAQIANYNLYTKASQYPEACPFFVPNDFRNFAEYLLLLCINVLFLHKPCTVTAVTQKVYIMSHFIVKMTMSKLCIMKIQGRLLSDFFGWFKKSLKRQVSACEELCACCHVHYIILHLQFHVSWGCTVNVIILVKDFFLWKNKWIF